MEPRSDNIWNSDCDIICVPVSREVRRELLGSTETEHLGQIGAQLVRMDAGVIPKLSPPDHGSSVHIIYEKEFSPIGRTVVGIVTKSSVTGYADLPNILKSMAELSMLSDARDWGDKKIGVPAPGCGSGGLEWEDISPYLGFLGPEFVFYDRKIGKKKS